MLQFFGLLFLKHAMSYINYLKMHTSRSKYPMMVYIFIYPFAKNNFLTNDMTFLGKNVNAQSSYARIGKYITILPDTLSR